LSNKDKSLLLTSGRQFK